jgi:hypothetical protein
MTNDTHWLVGTARVPYELAIDYGNARERILRSPRLYQFHEVLLADSYADNAHHLAWLCTAKTPELLAWAKSSQSAGCR